MTVQGTLYPICKGRDGVRYIYGLFMYFLVCKVLLLLPFCIFLSFAKQGDKKYIPQEPKKRLTGEELKTKQAQERKDLLASTKAYFAQLDENDKQDRAKALEKKESSGGQNDGKGK